MADLKRQGAGRRSRASGEAFEKLLSQACEYYLEKGMACIAKTPEPI